MAHNAVRAYYDDLVGRLPKPVEVHCIPVIHTVPKSPDFLRALGQLVRVDAVLAKPKSYGLPERQVIEGWLGRPVIQLDRNRTSQSAWVTHLVSDTGAADRSLVFADIGGYLAPSIDAAASNHPGLRGVLEGTENGIQRYEAAMPSNVPIFSVARSPLKLPEDHLVGAGVVFSIEAGLREIAEVLQTRQACVIGYGKIGRGVADALRGRGVSTAIYDTNPVARAEAAARGFDTFSTKVAAISRSTLIVGATGNKSVTMTDLALLRPNTVLATVTSADDELGFGAEPDNYTKHQQSNIMWEYVPKGGNGTSFYLVNDGNAANFAHGAVLGPALELIAGEKLAGIVQLATTTVQPAGSPYEVSAELRATVAEVWEQHFARDRG